MKCSRYDVFIAFFDEGTASEKEFDTRVKIRVDLLSLVIAIGDNDDDFSGFEFNKWVGLYIRLKIILHAGYWYFNKSSIFVLSMWNYF